MSVSLGTVLVVDDIPAIRMLIRGTLASIAETVHEAPTGREALRLAAEHRPDLLLLDLALPDMTGVDVIRELQSNPATAAIPVVIVTALAASDLARQAREAGAAAVVGKPFRPARLREVIEEVIGPIGSAA